MDGMEERKLNQKSALIVKIETGRKKIKMSNPKTKLRIYYKYSKSLYFLGLIFLFFAGFNLFTIVRDFNNFNTGFSLILIVAVFFFMVMGIMGIYYLTRPGKTRIEIIKCEKFEVITNENT